MSNLDFTKEQIKAYRQYFSLFDLDGNGMISGKELKEVSRRLGYRLTADQVKEIMEARNLDENGALSFDEFLLAMPANLINIPQEEHDQAEIRRIFMEFDTDGNGKVSVDEAHEILARELAFTPDQSREMILRYDKNGDGNLSYEEFVKFYSKVKAKSKQIRKLFNEFDKDQSGAVSVEEAKLMLEKLDMGTEDIETLVTMYDTNNDGQLQYQEFVQFLINT